MHPIVTALAGSIVLAHLARIVLPIDAQLDLLERFSVIPALLFGADPIEAVTRIAGHMYLHGGLPIVFGFIHLFFNVMIILQTGELVAQRLGRSAAGSLLFIVLFAACGAAGALFFVALNPASTTPMIGASGAACGLFAAYLLAAHPDWRVSLRSPQILQSGFWFLALNVGVAYLARTSGTLPIAWEAHAGGFIAGAIIYPMFAPRWRPSSPWS
jgi:membrane associated rhomboid family serine protease